MARTAEVVICGAGIAGVAAAYHLSVKQGVRSVVLVDERSPLTLTSDKSTECYRSFWPGPDGAMIGLMNRSIDLMEELAGESGDAFPINRRGYLYCTRDPARVADWRRLAQRAAVQGAGPLRESGYVANGDPRAPTTGADLLREPGSIHRHFPYVDESTVAALHVRRAGWLSGQQMGMLLLRRAQACGTELEPARLTGVELSGGAVAGVKLADGRTIATRRLVNAAGPFLQSIGRMIGIELPVFSERHAKLAFDDLLGVVPRDTPLLIWADPQRLAWSKEESSALAAADTRWMLGELPAGVHARPEGGLESTNVLMLWSYDAQPVAETFPIAFDPAFPEIVLRGLSTMIPGLRTYIGRAPRPKIDGGYYTRTIENRPLIGPLDVGGSYVLGALSGFGIMAACGAGELLAAHVTGRPLPDYAPAFDPHRYTVPAYQAALAAWGDSGQL